MDTVLERFSVQSEILEKNFIFHYLYAEGPPDTIVLVHDGEDYLNLGLLRECWSHDLAVGKGTGICFVLLPPGSSEQRWHYYDSAGTHSSEFVSFIYQELLPIVKSRFPSVTKWGMMGDSLAGAVSLRIALKNPDMWTYLLMQSAAFSKRDLEEVDALQTELPWRVYQSVGIYEDDFHSPITDDPLYIRTRNRHVYNSLPVRHMTYKEFEQDHLWECWRENLPSAIKIFY
ncbi:esterase family protein [Halobacillus litoralis]|uniref:alpha/beta hydrolase n=1 Tax=Halobacillus litoralis TaxID=45668 RepID=UPI001CD668E2|nr:alpha/beta hydrolase-fold protein [Halobacillus litoralis]MCA0970580.1 esterase family protein [Halobacillus litoralis]